MGVRELWAALVARRRARRVGFVLRGGSVADAAVTRSSRRVVTGSVLAA
jgi:hypothetical protein